MGSETNLALLRMSPQRAREILSDLSKAAVREYSYDEEEGIDEVDDALAVFDALVENQKPIVDSFIE